MRLSDGRHSAFAIRFEANEGRRGFLKQGGLSLAAVAVATTPVRAFQTDAIDLDKTRFLDCTSPKLFTDEEAQDITTRLTELGQQYHRPISILIVPDDVEAIKAIRWRVNWDYWDRGEALLLQWHASDFKPHPYHAALPFVQFSKTLDNKLGSRLRNVDNPEFAIDLTQAAYNALRDNNVGPRMPVTLKAMLDVAERVSRVIDEKVY